MCIRLRVNLNTNGRDTLTPHEILEDCKQVFIKKQADYSPGDSMWQNFTFSADFASRLCAGLPADDMRRSTAVLVGIKISRLMTLGLDKPAANEGIRDTISDLINYLSILQSQHDELKLVPLVVKDVETK